MGHKRKRNSTRPGSKVPRGLARVAAPTHRMQTLFTILDEVTFAADRALGSVEAPVADALEFDLAVMVRGINILKAVSILAENGHWEMAAAPTRQLLELVLNMEDLNRHDDRSAAAIAFGTFGLLQRVRGRLETILYEEETGREIDPAVKSKLIAALSSGEFDAFKGKPYADGTVRWVSSWNRKDAAAMSTASLNPMRKHHYNHLFRRWSEETHAAPGALIHSIARTATAGWVDEMIESDDRQTAEIASMAILLFFDLLEELPRAPDLGVARRLDWVTALRTWTVSYFEIPKTRINATMTTAEPF